MATSLDFSRSAFRYHSVFDYERRDAGINTRKKHSDSHLVRVVQTILIFVAFLLITLSAPVSLWFCLKKIKHYERVVVFRLGNLCGVKGPGWVVHLPLIDQSVRVNLETQAFSVPPQQVISSDGAIIELGADIHYVVSDAVQHVMNITQPRENLRSLARTSLLNLVMKRCQTDLERNKILVAKEICEKLNSTVKNWGLEVTQVELSSVKVLKEPEPVNPISQILNCFGASSGTVTPPNFKISPPLQDVEESKAAVGNLTKIKCFLERILVQSGNAAAMEGVLKLELTDQQAVFYISKAGVSGSCAEDPDIAVSLSEDTFYKVFNGVLSPLQAYLNGDIIVQGDVKKLMHLEMILSKGMSSKVLQV